MHVVIQFDPDTRTASLVDDSNSPRVFDRYETAYEYVCNEVDGPYKIVRLGPPERQYRTVIIAVDYYPPHFNVKTRLTVPGFWRAEVLEPPEPYYGSLKPCPFAHAETRQEAVSALRAKVRQQYGEDVEVRILTGPRV